MSEPNEVVFPSYPHSVLDLNLPIGPRAMHAAAVREIVERVDPNILLGVVMALTNGWANPNIVMDRIEKIKAGRD